LELNSNEELEHAKEIMVAAGYDVTRLSWQIKLNS
jgi:hypothetical protein